MTSKRTPPDDAESVTDMVSPKRPVGRPPLELPDPIPDTPENIARVVLNTKPKRRGEWRFEKRRTRKSDK